jgi:HlyD family secretion protein
MKKVWIFIFVLVLILAAGAGYHFTFTENNNREQQFSSYASKRQDIRRTVSASGRIEAHRNVEIKSKASGEIISMPFEVSDRVERGDTLVELDPVDERRNVRSAQSDLQTAKASYEDARIKTKRLEDLNSQGLASQEEYETQRLQMIRARVELEKREISLELAEQRLDETRIFAPFAGVVSERYVQVGQIISSGMSTVTDGTPILMLSDMSRLYAEASVDESDIGLVEVGQPAEISVDAYPDQKFTGKVRRIDVRGTSVSGVITYKTEVEILGDEKQKLRPEMTASVDIVVEESRDALVIPVAALQNKGRNYFVLAGSSPEEAKQINVEPGLRSGEYVEIVSGLDSGDTLWVSGRSGGEWSRRGSFSAHRLMR